MDCEQFVFCSEPEIIGWWKKYKMALKLSHEERRVVRHQLCKIFRYPEKIAGVPKHTVDWEDRKWMDFEEVIQCIEDTTSIKKSAAVKAFLLENKSHCKYWWTEGIVTQISVKIKGEPEFTEPWSLHPGIFN